MDNEAIDIYGPDDLEGREKTQEHEEPEKERWELVEAEMNNIMFDTDELHEIILRTGTLDDLSAFVRGDDDAIWAFKQRVCAEAKRMAEESV